MRYLFLVHRYLGIAVSVLMVAWCASGVLMLYVPYPSLSETIRFGALQPLDVPNCCSSAATVLQSEALIERVSIEMMAGRALADVQTQAGLRTRIDLQSGKVLPDVDPVQAAAVAERFAQRWMLPAKFASVMRVQDDQWTVSGEFARDRPLYKFAWRDGKSSELYVSAATGAAVQFTTRSVRLGNWLGAVPHWLYFTALRRHGAAWAQVVIIASLLGCFLTAIGLYIGIHQYRHRAPNRLSPYRGFLWWHHAPGLFFGMFALTWILSGLLSMNPWGLLQSSDAQPESRQLAGELPSWGAVLQAVRKIAARPELKGVVALRSAALGGELMFIAAFQDGRRARIDAGGGAAPLSARELTEEARILSEGRQTNPDELQQGDEFYYPHRHEIKVLPVYRIQAANTDRTRYYLDPVSGEIVMKADRNARGYRWGHDALHRLDFSKVLRSAPAFDIAILTLLLGVLLVCATGCYAALRRIALWLN